MGGGEEEGTVGSMARAVVVSISPVASPSAAAGERDRFGELFFILVMTDGDVPEC